MYRAIDPDFKMSERRMIMVEDVLPDDFERAWLEVPNELQEEFGWDMPNISVDDVMNGYKWEMEFMTFDEYVAYVQSWIESGL